MHTTTAHNPAVLLSIKIPYKQKSHMYRCFLGGAVVHLIVLFSPTFVIGTLSLTSCVTLNRERLLPPESGRHQIADKGRGAAAADH